MNILFFGDSITLGYGLAHEEDRFSSVVCRMLGARELNAGATGTLIAAAGMSRDNGSAFVHRMHTLPKADKIIVFGATNDYYWTDGPLDEAEPVSEEEGSFTGAMTLLCRFLLQSYSPRDIVFLTPYRQRGIGWETRPDGTKEVTQHPTGAPNASGCALLDYVRAIRTICGCFSIPVLDLYDGLPWRVDTSDRDLAAYTQDGCHPNVNGNMEIALALLDFLRSNRLV